jgi:lipopolysaccharide export system permease protein
MLKPGLLDRYLLREWTRIFVGTVVGFPLIVIAFDLTDKLDQYLSRGLKPSEIALSYVYGLPEKLFLVIPAAVLFATVFSIGAMGRHSEITAAKASGRSFLRITAPALGAALVAAVLALILGEIAPTLTRRQLELLGDRVVQAQTFRPNFVFRADEGWVYAVRSLEIAPRTMTDVVLEREGAGADYPTLVVEARTALYQPKPGRWTLNHGRVRIVVPGRVPELTFSFDSLRQKSLVETPAALLAEPKAPDEMRYGELGRYVEALERSGGDGRKLRVERALKLAIPGTCLIIAIFAAPLAITSPRAGGAFGVGVSLAVTVLFLTLVQLSKAIGSGGLLPPTVAAWAPNALFLALGIWLLKRAPT